MGGRRDGRGEGAQERLEWRSTTESRDYSRINSLLAYVGTGVGFYGLVWAVVSIGEKDRPRTQGSGGFLRNLAGENDHFDGGALILIRRRSSVREESLS